MWQTRDLELGRSRCCRLGLVVVLVMVLLSVPLTACGSQQPTRSAAAACQVWKTDGYALHSQYQSDAAHGGLASLGDLIAAPNDLATLMDKMAAVAPSGIEPDFASVAKALDQAASEDSSNPVSGLISGLVSALATSGSYNRVDQYILAQCGPPPGTEKRPSQTAPLSPTSTVVPEPETLSTLSDTEAGKNANVLLLGSDGIYQTVNLRTRKLTRIQPVATIGDATIDLDGSGNSSYFAALSAPFAGHPDGVVVIDFSESVPQQGLTAGTDTGYLEVIDPDSGREISAKAVSNNLVPVQSPPPIVWTNGSAADRRFLAVVAN